MKRFGIPLVTVALVLAAGSSFATTYYWNNTSTASGAAQSILLGSNWTSATDGTTGTVPGASDDAIDANGGYMYIPANAVISFGSLRYGSTTTGFTEGTQGSETFNIGGDATTQSAGSGDFFNDSTSVSSGAPSGTFNIWGNVLFGQYQFNGNVAEQINLRGTNKAERIARPGSGVSFTNNIVPSINIYGSYWDNGGWSVTSPNWPDKNVYTIKVKGNGRIITNPTASVASAWQSRVFVLECGTLSLPSVGDCVTFQYYPKWTGTVGDNGMSVMKLAIAAGVTYPQDVRIGQSYNYHDVAPKADSAFVWRLQTGPVSGTMYPNTNATTTTVSRDLNVSILADGSATSYPSALFLIIEENGTQAKRYLNVGRDLIVGNQTGNGTSSLTDFADCSTTQSIIEHGPSGIQFKNSVVHVGRDVLFGQAGTSSKLYARNESRVTLDNGTVTIGRNLTLNRMDAAALAYWKANNANNTSTLIFDGGGTSQAQVITTFGYLDNVMLGSVRINNPGGTVSLDCSTQYSAGNKAVGGSLLLHGDLSIECGTFSGKGQVIAFNGPSHTLTNLVNPSSYQFDDNINLLAGSVLYLGSDITLKTGDNLNLAAGSSLYLNGHILQADGMLYDGRLTQTWTNDLGTIFGASMSVPEPATLFLLGSGALGAIGYVRRRRVS